MKGEELKRIEKNNNGEVPGTTQIIVRATNVRDVEKVLDSTKEIMRCVSQYAYTDIWPSDEEWKEFLPQWFVESMVLKTSKDRDEDLNLYHFESWVANVKDRAWVWWSSKVDGNNLEFVLETLSIPYLYSTFVYILYSQGVPMGNISIEDDID